MRASTGTLEVGSPKPLTAVRSTLRYTSLVVALVFALLAAAPERRPTAVTFSGPDECPARERYQSELTFRSDRIELTSPDAATAQVVVVIVRKKRQFEGTVVVTTSSGKAVTKRVSGPKCESVTAALSLAAALVLDPEAKLGVVPQRLPPPEPEPPPQVLVEPELAPPVLQPEPPPPAPVPGSAPAAVVTPPVRPPSVPLRFALHAAADVATTISGGVDPSFGLSASLLVPARVSFVSRLSGAGGTGRSVTNPNGTVVYGAHFTAHLEVGAALPLGVFRPEVTVGARLVGATLQGQGADEVTASTRVLAEAGPRARGVFVFGAWEVAAAGGASASLTRERYLFQPAGVVFSVPAWAAWAQVSVGRSFQ